MSAPVFSYSSADDGNEPFPDRPRINVAASLAPVITEIEANYRAHDFGNGWGSRWEATTQLYDGEAVRDFVLNRHSETANKGNHTEAFTIEIRHLAGLVEMLAELERTLHDVLEVDTGRKTDGQVPTAS